MSKIEPGSFGGQEGFVGTPSPFRPGQRPSEVKPMVFSSTKGGADAALSLAEAMLKPR